MTETIIVVTVVFLGIISYPIFGWLGLVGSVFFLGLFFWLNPQL